MSLSDVKHWVFDMDGTLTVAVSTLMSWAYKALNHRKSSRIRNCMGCELTCAPGSFVEWRPGHRKVRYGSISLPFSPNFAPV